MTSPHQPTDTPRSPATSTAAAATLDAPASGAGELYAATPRQRGGVRITVEPVISGPDIEHFYELYLEAFGALRTMAVARHVLHEDEFHEEMVDPLIDKYVAWDEAGNAVALATLTHHLETVPWISPDYFAHHYPEHFSRNAVFYLGFVLADPGRRRQRMFTEILAAVTRRVADDRGICGWDACAFNLEHVRMFEVVSAVAQTVMPTEVVPIDTQTYFCSTPEVSRTAPETVAKLPQMRQVDP